MNRKPRLITVCSTLLAAVAVIAITAGCGKGKETPVGTDVAPPAAPLATEAGPGAPAAAGCVRRAPS